MTARACRVRCATCGTPGPAAPTMREARAAARARRWRRSNGKDRCRNCLDSTTNRQPSET